MINKKIEQAITILETTLGDMSPREADALVRVAIDILRGTDIWS